MHFFYFKSLKIHYNLKVDFFPKSMRRLYGFGDVLLTHPSESGVLLIKHKPQAHPWLYLWYNSKILWWSISLSCIDSSVLKNRLNFHCRLDSDSSTCCIWHLNLSTKKWWVHYCSWKWWIVLYNTFKELFIWISEELVSNITGYEYCLPGAVAVLVLTSKKDLSLNSYDLYFGIVHLLKIALFQGTLSDQ